MIRKTLFFDVNETLLDLTPVRASVAKVLEGHEDGVALWFKSLLHLSLVYSAGEKFSPFGQLAAVALQNVARSFNIEINEHEAEQAIQPILRCEPHEDILPGLKILRKKGFRLYALTNSSSDALKQQMDHSNLGKYFKQCLSVEEIGIYKPHKKVYQWAVEQAGERIENCTMIAAHDWDVMGAKWAGLSTIFINRGYLPLLPKSAHPDVVTNSLKVIAQQL